MHLCYDLLFCSVILKLLQLIRFGQLSEQHTGCPGAQGPFKGDVNVSANHIAVLSESGLLE